MKKQTSHVAKVVPVPGQDNEAERRRIRQSNDNDQRAEKRGKPSRHNRGYDEAADGDATPLVNPIDED